jgi:CheY-like chemotaxis protein
VFAIIALAVQPSLGQDLPIGTMVLAAGKGVGLLFAALVVSRYVLPLLFRFVSMQPELMLLSAITWCFAVCFAAIKLEFSLAMGALIAGMSISTLPYTLDVVAKIRSLRDFFVTLFFVSLGMLMAKPTGTVLMHAAVLSIIVIASRFLLIWPTLRVLGQDNRVGLLSSIHLSQSSEFGLLIALIGLSFSPAHITQDIVSLVVIVLVVTSTISTYMINFSHAIARLVVRGSEATPLKDRLSTHGEDQHSQPADVMLIGCYRVGASLVPRLAKSGRDFSVVDFNIVLHDKLRKRGVRCIYGDISHADTLEHAGVHQAKVLVCSISDDFLRGIDNLRLLHVLRKMNPKAAIVVTAQSAKHAIQLYRAGADHVLLNRELAAADAQAVVEGVLDGRPSDKSGHMAVLQGLANEEI